MDTGPRRRRHRAAGAWVAEITDIPDLSTWPKGMRLIVRKERPRPGAQLRFTDLDGLRLTCFATNTQSGQLADLELRPAVGLVVLVWGDRRGSRMFWRRSSRFCGRIWTSVSVGWP
ncbi:hypothetical protein [Streptomyces sp. NPDC005780]|uniref:hypothetical protein n=1 Tax=Streptomyces sp. NPDC005780 TaxID=3364730 RepID=UPI003695A8B3